jgi:hypothetical protein
MLDLLLPQKEIARRVTTASSGQNAAPGEEDFA